MSPKIFSNLPDLLHLKYYDLLLWSPGILLGYCIFWLAYTRTLHPLSKIPGPFWPSVTRLWLVIQVGRGDVEHTQRALHRKYGPLVRIAPNEVACADPEAIRKIYPAQDPLTKTDFYSAMGNKTFSKYSDHFTEIDEQMHAERRKIVNHIYSMSNVLSSESYIDSCSELFVQRMGEYADEEKVMDLGEWLLWYAFDVIGELFFGHMFGFMEKSYDHKAYVQTLDTLLPVISVVAVASKSIRPFILISSLFNSATRRALNAIDHLASSARNCVAERRAALANADEGRSRHDLLQQLLDIVNSKGDKLDFGIGEVENEAYVALGAGAETSAIALRACFYYLMKNPDIYKQVQAEVDNASASGELSSPVRYLEACKLPLVCACIKEAMRLHPSTGLTLPRIVPKNGLEVAGQYIPAGWRIGMNPAVVGYNEDVYGSDASEFRPARWLEGDVTRMDRSMFVFGTGTRTCLGKNIALSEIHKLVPFVLHLFDLELAEPSKEWQTRNHWLNKQTDIRIRVKRHRKHVFETEESN